MNVMKDSQVSHVDVHLIDGLTTHYNCINCKLDLCYYNGSSTVCMG